MDSGGQGLVVVLRGMYDALTGKVTDFKIEGVSKQKLQQQERIRELPLKM